MINLEEGLVLSGRAVWGLVVGFITNIDRETYTIRWIDGNTTTQLRPDEDEEIEEAA